MSDDDDLAPIIRLPRSNSFALNEREAALDELPVRTKRAVRPCPHTGSFVDPVARTLTCRACGAALDPIAVLERLARTRETIVLHGIHLRREVDALRQTVAELERQERNAKARIRSARKRRGDDHAVLEAARALFAASGRIPFDDLHEAGKADFIRELRAGIEAYLAALDPADEATA